jgi:tRNA (cmo5U34)-methyltransferase
MAFRWNPDTYLELMNTDVPDYERLQEETASATGHDALRILELGIGTGETARRVLERHPLAVLFAIDESAAMLDRARATLPAERTRLALSRLEDVLPEGPFDVIVSALAVHHLDGPGKQDLFARAATALSPGGRLVVGDVVIPERAVDLVTPVDDDYDTPSSVPDQLAWLRDAGLHTRVEWSHRDLAVLVGEKR